MQNRQETGTKLHQSTSRPKTPRSLPQKLLTLALYSLPVIFFFVCYFLIVTSGEDLLQGASTPADVLGDALSAFHHSARLADMFAWSVINFFDYIFSFGVDTFFRLLDVLSALSVFYFTTYLVLRRRPRLRLPDACVFSGLFLLVFLTPNGRILYAGFSAIHNYLFICFFTLLFLLPFARVLWGRPPLPAFFSHHSLKTPTRSSKASLKASQKSSLILKVALPASMFLLGFLFGFASNVTGLVFLLSLPLFLLYKLLSKKLSKSKTSSEPSSVASSRPQNLLPLLLSSVLGVLSALFLIYVVGSGLSDYTSSPDYLVYDYLPFSSFLSSPFSSLLIVLKHILNNFARFFAPFLILSLPLASYAFYLKRRRHLPSLGFSDPDKNFLSASLIFILLHLLAFSQIYYPTRLVLPAYLLASVIFIFVGGHFLSAVSKIPQTSQTPSKSASSETPKLPVLSPKSLLLSVGIISLVLLVAVLSVRTFFAISYLKKVTPLLAEIKSSSSASLCVTESAIDSPILPFVYLGQEPLLADWAMPETIYDKTITYCE